jgi:localization factor PodJL
MESHLLETVRRVAAIEAAIPREPRAAPELHFPIEAAQSEIELPPFAEPLSQTSTPRSAVPGAEPIGAASSEAAEPANAGQEPARLSAVTYLAQARRAAQIAAEAEAELAKRSRNMRAAERDADGRGKSGVRRLATAAGFIVLVAVGYSAVRLQSNLVPPAPTIAASIPSTKAPLQVATTSPAALPSSSPGPATPAAQPQTEAPAAVNQTASAAPASTLAPAAARATTGLASLLAQANSGDMKAATLLGLKYADGDGISVNESEAARWLSKAANAGEAVAAYRLGTLYERGRGVTPDARQAMRWYAEAAKHGNRRAMHNLAVGYADGVGGEKNFAEAARWFKAAAELGLTDSQFNIAVLYERGLGVKQSFSEAYKWYAIAAASGDAESKTRVSALANQLKPGERDAANKAAKAYKPEPINIAANES